MASTFDPYAQWLGIVSDGFHPDRYRLLGLPAFESDPAKITAAADAQLKHVRQFTSGPDAAAARKLIEELETSRMCLLDGMKKTIYDNLLKQQLATRAARQAAAEAEAQAAVPATPAGRGPNGRGPNDLGHAPASPAPVAASPSASPTAAAATDGDIDSLLPPVADADALLPPTAAPAGPAQAIPIAGGAPPTMPGYPKAVPVSGQAMPVQAMPVQAVPVQGVPVAPQYPRAAPAYPAGYPVPGAVPQAVPVGGYGAPVVAQAVPVDPYGMAVEPAYPAAPAVDFAPTNTTTRTAVRRRNNTTGMLMMFTIVPAVLVGVFALGYYLLEREGFFDEQSAQTPAKEGTAVAAVDRQPRLPPPRYQDLQVSPTESTVARPGRQPDRQRTERNRPDRGQSDTMSDDEANMPADDPAMDPDEGESPAMAGGADVDVAWALMAARYQMAERNLAIAKVRLNEAKGAARGEAEKAEVARVAALLAYVEQFQKAVKESLTALKNKEAFAYGDERIGVVDVTSDLLVVRIGGANKEYPTDNLPSKLAVAVAEDWFDNNPANKLAIGAFLVVHPKGDRDRARALWQEAQNAGLSEEAALVMPELDVTIPTEFADADGPEPAAMAVSDDGRAVVPAADVLRPARNEVKKVYADDYAAAKAPPQRRDLADKLLTEALAMDGNSVQRYALLAEALELAEQAGDAGVIVRAADVMAEAFAVDGWELKVNALETAAKEAKTPEASAGVARSCLELTDLAVVFELYDVAGDLSKVALTAARKSKDGELLKSASARGKEIAQLRSGG